MKNAQYWIENLKLDKHPEGGYYKEVYRSDEFLKGDFLPKRYGGDRSYATSIYFLLKDEEYSAFHRIRSDETWHFYYGDPLELFFINDQKQLERVVLGNDPGKGQYLQFTVRKNFWFAARLIKKEGFALLGCTVAPGFHFDDFELADKKELNRMYPELEKIIGELCIK